MSSGQIALVVRVFLKKNVDIGLCKNKWKSNKKMEEKYHSMLKYILQITEGTSRFLTAHSFFPTIFPPSWLSGATEKSEKAWKNYHFNR